MKMQGGSSEILVSPCSVSMFKADHALYKGHEFCFEKHLCGIHVVRCLCVFGDPLYWTSMEFNLSQFYSCFLFLYSLVFGVQYSKCSANLMQT